MSTDSVNSASYLEQSQQESDNYNLQQQQLSDQNTLAENELTAETQLAQEELSLQQQYMNSGGQQSFGGNSSFGGGQSSLMEGCLNGMVGTNFGNALNNYPQGQGKGAHVGWRHGASTGRGTDSCSEGGRSHDRRHRSEDHGSVKHSKASTNRGDNTNCDLPVNAPNSMPPEPAAKPSQGPEPAAKPNQGHW